jgi:hypothetical protein
MEELLAVFATGACLITEIEMIRPALEQGIEERPIFLFNARARAPTCFLSRHMFKSGAREFFDVLVQGNLWVQRFAPQPKQEMSFQKSL